MARIDTCRSCDQGELQAVLNLGSTPLADRFPSRQQLTEPEPRFPLELVFCGGCSLLQITETVAPEVLFCDAYPYYSSISPQLLRHARDNALELIEARGLDSDSLVVELASNDGYLLRNYLEQGIKVLGIDPARGPAQAAAELGVNTLPTFFSRELAEDLAARGTRADVIHANNVLAHVADLNGFVSGIASVLDQAGVAVMEVPYAQTLIEHCEFDTIYHEHLCYFSATALDRLFRRHQLYINDIRELTIHGGSLRLYIEKNDRQSAAVQQLLTQEARDWAYKIEHYRDFAQRSDLLGNALLTLLRKLRGEGKRIAAYGAAAKGSTLLNSLGIGPDLVDYVVDRSHHKQGLHMPGQHQPIYPPDKLLESPPDYLLLLAWNFADEIRTQQHAYEAGGGRFIVPVPYPRILEPLSRA
tara:strand:+ start:57218 stop:58462 length:1245 start_codon:yes stop_codon:yes gene_type:complete